MNKYSSYLMLAMSICTIRLLGSFSQVNQSFTADDQGIMRINAHTKHNLPVVAQSTASNTYCSFFKTNNAVYHPTPLFSDDKKLSTLFSKFIESIQNKPDFLPFFSKIHLLILHQLYVYLTTVYATFSMSHAQTIKEYYLSEERYALSTKMLVIFDLITLIESQLNQAIRSRLPGMPQNMASYSGVLALKQDYSCDIGVLITHTEQSIQKQLDDASSTIINNERQSYLRIYGNYLSFFREYCACIDQEHADNSSVFNLHALGIKNSIQNNSSLKALKTINPSVFFYDDKTMKIIQTLPLLAKMLPDKIESVPWPAIVVQHAKNGTQARTNFNSTLLSSSNIATQGIPLGYEIAFFDVDIQNNKELFINIPITNSGNQSKIYSQKLAQQPDWLNTPQGVLSMLKVCLGDFSRLLLSPLNQEPIIDPFLTCITYSAAQQAAISVQANSACSLCSAFFKSINQQSSNIPSEFSPQLPPP